MEPIILKGEDAKTFLQDLYHPHPPSTLVKESELIQISYVKNGFNVIAPDLILTFLDNIADQFSGRTEAFEVYKGGSNPPSAVKIFENIKKL